MENDIIIAINSLKLIELNYGPGNRLIEPHAIGYSSTGNLLLRAYQTKGASSSNTEENWKLFRIDRIHSLSITTENFLCSRQKYNPNDPAMKGGIIACIKKS